MKYIVAIFDIGEVKYSAIARKILCHYFEKYNIPYQFITSTIIDGQDVDIRKCHPSWLKMIVHRFLPSYDYIICWDLDLLPKFPSTEVLSFFDFTKLTMAVDSPGNTVPFSPNFKYNGGLIGIPSSLFEFTESIYNTHAPGKLPSYEQYYLNEEIASKKITVHELPRTINVLYPVKIEERPLFYDALLQHYTYGVGSVENRTKLIHQHALRYFNESQQIVYSTREEMVEDLVKKEGTYGEIGVFIGDFSKYLYSNLQPHHLALFDLFEGLCGSGDVNGNNMHFVQNLHTEYEKLSLYFQGEKVAIHKGDSKQLLAEKYEDNTFDMLYIDAEHTYESVKKDLEQSFKKVKHNGFIMGHDYDVNKEKTDKNYDYSGVRQAVKEFCETYNQKILAFGLDGCISFCIQINKHT
jgi:hypothetical protein